MNHMQKRFIPVAILAISLFAPLSAQAQSPAPGPELAAKMVKLASTKGHDGKIGPRFATALGLTTAGPWADHEVVGGDGAVDYYIAVGPAGDSNLLLYGRSAKGVAAFRLSRDGTLISAMNMDIATKAITMRTPAEAQADLDAEAGFWAPVIDGFLAPK